MNYVVIFAGGVGKRMNNGDLPKQFLKVKDKEIIIHTLEHFEASDLINGIVIACKSEWIDYLKKLLQQYQIKKVIDVVPGGETGQLSIYQGIVRLNHLSNRKDDIVLIHDGVRPLIDAQTISDNITMTKNYGSCITGVKVTETIIQSFNGLNIEEVYERDPMFIAKAPQTFYLKDIVAAHQKAISENKVDYVDSCTLMQACGYHLHMFLGDNKNIKITTPIDYFMFKAIIENEKEIQLCE